MLQGRKDILGGYIILLTIGGILKLETLISGGNKIESSIRWIRMENRLQCSLLFQVWCKFLLSKKELPKSKYWYVKFYTL